MLKKLPLILMIVSVSALMPSCTRADDHVEAAILKAVDDGMPQARATLEKAVNINSGTMNFEGVKQVGDLFAKELADIGFKTEWEDGTPYNRSGHLIAHYGTKGPKILMIGHLDTVFAKGDDFQKYEPQNDRYVKGPGISDMKGGDVIIISAVRALKAAGVLDDVSIRIVMTGDEEASGRPLSLSKKALIDAAIWADVALGFEDADGNIKTGVVARRGSVNWSLDVTGTAAHSSQIFKEEVGDGAVFEAARILNGFREKLKGVENLTFNPGRIVGGTRITEDKATATGTAFGKNNVVAQTLRVTGGIRAISPEQLTAAQAEMQQITAAHLPKTSATLTFGDGYPPMSPTDGNYKLLSMYSDISEQLGYGPIAPVNPRNAGAADISFAADHVEMAIDGLGLMGTGGHTKDEVADMNTLKQNTEKAALLIYKLSQ